MRADSSIRRIDELGRIVIPKEIRYKLNIKEGDALEIYTDKNCIIIKKYSDAYTLRKMEEWEELENPTGEIIACGHSISPEDILIALGVKFVVVE